MKLTKGIKTSELWVVMALFAKSLGVDSLINPETINNTVEVAQKLRELPYADNGPWPYIMATVYVAARSGIKMFEVRYLGGKDASS